MYLVSSEKVGTKENLWKAQDFVVFHGFLLLFLAFLLRMSFPDVIVTSIRPGEGFSETAMCKYSIHQATFGGFPARTFGQRQTWGGRKIVVVEGGF